MSHKSSLTLGPVYYLWAPEKWRDFYYAIADESPVKRVTIGETICSKRLHFTEKMLDDVVERLTAAGKEVVFSTLAMVTLEREVKEIRKVLARENALIEVNDLSSIYLIGNRYYTVGPLINVYNSPTARFLANRGAKTICLPPELPFSSIKTIAKEVVNQVELEVFAFGRVPLAISARCAHARAKGHVKDNCRFVCGEETNGLPIKTLDGNDFLSLNGIQTMSYSCQALIHEIQDLIEAGINRFRLSPHDCQMIEVTNIFQQLIELKLSIEEATASLREFCGDMTLSNGFIAGLEGSKWIERSSGNKQKTASKMANNDGIRL